MEWRPIVWLGLLGLMAAAGAAAAEENAAVVSATPQYEVLERRNLVYFEGEPADAPFHRLDLYLPRDRQSFPVVVFIHGGAWLIGDKDDFGVYAAIGRMYAVHGIGAVQVNYRLSPRVQHPEHIKDVARAFAWTKNHIAEYGGRPDRLFISGHSAGGHLAALLATDEQYLQAEGLKLADIRGAMPMSGVYRIPDRFLASVFGAEASAHQAASPIQHVKEDCPPMLVVYGDRDFPICGPVSEEFGQALRGKQAAADVLMIRNRNHIDLLTNTARNADPSAQALRAFVQKYSE